MAAINLGTGQFSIKNNLNDQKNKKLVYPEKCSNMVVSCSTIISNKDGLYELPHELQNDIELRISGN